MVEKVVIGNAELWLGDCRDILSEVKADAVVTDPPYGIGIGQRKNRGKGCLAAATDYKESDWDDRRIDSETLNLIISCANWAIIWGGNYFELPGSRCWLVWDKMTRGQDMAAAELAWTNLPGGVRLIRWMWVGFFRDGNDPRGLHPAQKPESVMSWAIGKIPNPNTVIFDPFMGSGTCGIAALSLGRRFIGCEIDPHYFDIACQRIEQAQKQARLFDNEPSFTMPVEQAALL